MVLILYFTSFSHKFHKGAVHKVRQAIFGQFLPPSPCHTLSHIPGPSPPNKYVTYLGPPIFSRPSTKNPDKSSMYKFSLNCSRGFCPGGFPGVSCLEGFVRGGFCLFPLLSECICYNRKLNITLNFMFHMYDKEYISVTSRHMLLTPLPPVTNCHTFSEPLPHRA